MPRKGLTATAVVEAACALLQEKGFRELTLHSLAARLDVKTASLYTHIRGIDDLCMSLAKMALGELGAAVSKAAHGKGRADALRAIAAAYCEYVGENPEMYRMIMRIPKSSSEELIEAGRAVKSVLFETLARYTGDAGEILQYSREYHSLLHGFASLEEAGFFDGKNPPGESFERIVANFVQRLEAAYPMGTGGKEKT